MIWTILIAIIAAFLFRVSRQPDDFTVARKISVNATAADIFPWVNNLKNMNQWNPWAGQDEKSVINYEGPEEGPGAVYTWAGGKQGAGKFTIMDVKPPHELNCRLEMYKPFAADNTIKYTITETGGTTLIVWAMSGKNALMHKGMQTFFSMDKMVGKEFEKGLSSLKVLVERKKVN
jgi:Polyketide cyclase / dehydrase and lipid transport